MVQASLVTTLQSQATVPFKKALVLVVEAVKKGEGNHGVRKKKLRASTIFCVSSEAMSHVLLSKLSQAYPD